MCTNSNRASGNTQLDTYKWACVRLCFFLSSFSYPFTFFCCFRLKCLKMDIQLTECIWIDMKRTCYIASIPWWLCLNVQFEMKILYGQNEVEYIWFLLWLAMNTTPQLTSNRFSVHDIRFHRRDWITYEPVFSNQI